METSVVGKRVPRLDALEQAKGQTRYLDDLPELPGTLHAMVHTSRYPSAEILGVDVSEAVRLPGVAAVITARDVPNNVLGLQVADEYVFADKRTHYRGEAIAAVAAETPEIARMAVERIRVEYRELEPVFDPREAMKPDAPLVHPERDNLVLHAKLRRGDVEQGFSQSDLVVEDHFETQLVEHSHMETHGGTAHVDHNGKLTVRTSTQMPFIVRILLQMALGLPATKIRVIKTDVGGAFGGKNELAVEHHIALLAMRTGRPVKMVWRREDEFQRSTLRHRMFMDYKTGVKKDGTLMAVQVQIIMDNGPITSWSMGPPKKAFLHFGPYRVPNVKVDNFLVSTNMPPQCSMRGFGSTSPTFGAEVHMEHVARTAGIDSVAFRLKNALREGDILACGQTLGTCGLGEAIRRVAEASSGTVR
ncbi:MAG: molybdopterin cofactor-binding domain-containing protein [Pseudomonadota bacterium]